MSNPAKWSVIWFGTLCMAILTGCGAVAPNQPAQLTQTVAATNPAYDNLNPSTLPPGFTVPSQATVFKNVQTSTSWKPCIGTCANAATPLTYGLLQNMSTAESLNSDGTAASLSEGGTPFGDVLWYNNLGSSAATHFIIDLYIKIDHPENVQALEFALQKHDGLTWYKSSTQCGYSSGALRAFNLQTFHWASLGAKCVPAQANTWQRVTLQYSITGGTTNFEAVSFDGVYQPLSVSLPPVTQTTASESMGVHIQLDNANTTAGYTVYVDDWTVYAW